MKWRAEMTAADDDSALTIIDFDADTFADASEKARKDAAAQHARVRMVAENAYYQDILHHTLTDDE